MSPTYLVLKVGIGFFAALLRFRPFGGDRAVGGGLVQDTRNLLSAQIARVVGRVGGVVERQRDCRREQLLVSAQQSNERLERVKKHSDDGQINHQQQEDGHLGQPRQPQILHRPSLARRGSVAAILALFVEGHAAVCYSGAGISACGEIRGRTSAAARREGPGECMYQCYLAPAAQAFNPNQTQNHRHARGLEGQPRRL